MAKLTSKDEWKLWAGVAAVIIVTLGWLFFASRPPTEGGEKLWRVERVTDARTLSLKGSGQVIDLKLVGLDIPPSHEQAAKDFLAEALLNKWVRAKVLREGPEKIKAGFVFLSSEEVNARMIRQGLAKIDQAEKDFDLRPYMELEQEAKSKLRGLWSPSAPGAK
jgi:endonuclease YncB( thermonuclease family)